MHPSDALHAALAGKPADLRDFIAAIPAQSGLTFCSTRDSDDALKEVQAAEQAIIYSPSASVTRLTGTSVKAWNVRWAQDKFMLHGHLYAGSDKKPDPFSPLLLVDRFRLIAYHGPELARLAYRALGDSLAWHAFHDREPIHLTGTQPPALGGLVSEQFARQASATARERSEDLTGTDRQDDPP